MLPRGLLPTRRQSEGVLSEWLHRVTGIEAATAARLTSTISILALIIALRLLLISLAKRRGLSAAARYRIRRASGYVAGSLSLVVLASIWLRGFHSVATFAGLLSAGLAIALKDVAAGLAGWAFILWRRPFELGDRIELGGLRGDVVDIRLFEFSVMEVGNWIGADDRTGRIVHVPNSKVFTETVANYTKGWFEQVWDEIDVVVTFESDWRAARELLEVIVDMKPPAPDASQAGPRATAHYLVMDASLQPAVFLSVVDIGVRFTLRYVCHPRERRATQERVWTAVLEAFEKREDIDFAYPTTRFYDNATEGKPTLRPAN